ncbi:LpxI family protein [Phenylobacterium aquaticum]|uniref:UDP-2,3-diacylglucosamine diphosphatase n=1 Tax=Phenylobacterium aquaticum TaxID=1763816 RepID=UPI0026EF8F54|nr:UDP-2,3-diacylglucosamine diphosphatase LpxI [Phenylobacterium aquaticum]
MRKLGLIAGGGTLPVEIAAHCEQAGRPFFIVRLKGFAGPELADYPGADIGLGEVGKCIKALKRAGCQSVCLVGNVSRPDFKNLKLDFRGMSIIPAVIKAARSGDDALLRVVLGEFAKEGFVIEGAHEANTDLTLGAGPLGKVSPLPEHQADINRALHVAREIGRLDIGQGAVVCDGLVLAVEAQEGTDAMLRRVAHEIPTAVRGQPGAYRGVLAKAPKPIQETKVDLPTIGVATVQRAAAAGLAGIVGEVGHLLVLDREQVIDLADDLGLFILGVERQTP